MIKAVIFDFEGVIVDSEPVRYETWRTLFRDRFGVNLPEYNQDIALKINGRKQTDNVRYFLDMFNIKGDADMLIKERKKLLFDIYNRPGEIKPVEGLLEFLEFLKDNGIKCAIATSSYNDTTEKILHDLGIGSYFISVVTGEDVLKGKPEPDLFLKASTELGINPSECVVIEDSLNGIVAAKSAGMRCVAITTTFSEEYLKETLKGINLIVGNMKELISRFGSL